jgi:alanine-glyoxylate transaminase/serine-glyoxylate transaminase/serine-pyruvate transaminase
MREALDMLADEGLENVWARHAVLAGAVRAAVGAWSSVGGVEHFVVEPAARSNAVTTVLTGSIDAERLRKVCEVEAGLTLGLALAAGHGNAFRIGHMGHLNPPMVLGTLATTEAALIALGAPVAASGTAAAAAVIAEHLDA